MTNQGISSYAHKGMVRAAEGMALAAIELFTNEDELAKIREEFEAFQAKNPYLCPIPKDVQPSTVKLDNWRCSNAFCFDHLVHFVENPNEAIEVLKEKGIHAIKGGEHQNGQTYNTLSYFDLSYIEFIGVFDKQRI